MIYCSLTVVLASTILMLALILIWETAIMCLFGVFRPTQEFTNQLNMKPLPMKGCKFLPLLGTYAVEH